MEELKLLDKICEWSARKADLEAKDLDEWETIYYQELERLDNQVNAIERFMKS